MPGEIEPLYWSVRCIGRCAESVVEVVVGVHVGVQGGIPEGSAVCFVVQDAEREDVGVGAGGGVVGVGAYCRVYDGLKAVSNAQRREVLVLTRFPIFSTAA